MESDIQIRINYTIKYVYIFLILGLWMYGIHRFHETDKENDSRCDTAEEWNEQICHFKLTNVTSDNQYYYFHYTITIKELYNFTDSFTQKCKINHPCKHNITSYIMFYKEY